MIGITLAAVVFLCGLALLVLALRGRRIDNHRLCRRCGYDLVGSPEAEDCPECGATGVLWPRGNRIGNRRRSPTMLLLASALLLVGTVGLTGAVLAATGRIDWQQHKPVWLLRREALQHGSTAAQRALDELDRRLQLGSLSSAQASALVADALAVQADASIPWQPQWGGFVERAHTLGTLAQADWERYARNSAAPGMTLRVRPRVRRGDNVTFSIGYPASRVAENGSLWLKLSNLVPVVEDRALPAIGSSSGHLLSPDGFGSIGSSFDLRPPVLDQISDGDHPLEIRAHVAVHESDSGPLIVEFDLTFRGSFELGPADEPTVRALVNDADRAAMTDRITVRSLEVKNDRVSCNLDVGALPVAIAAEVVLRDSNGREWKIGGVSQPAGKKGGWGTGSQAKELPGVVDVILRPSAVSASNSVEVTDYWGEEIVFKDVPVRRPTP